MEKNKIQLISFDAFVELAHARRAGADKGAGSYKKRSNFKPVLSTVATVSAPKSSILCAPKSYWCLLM